MLIQDEAPRPTYPLATLEEDYERAVLHLAWDHHLRDGQRTLLFGMVELLPTEVPPPLDDGEQREQMGERGDHRLHLRRVLVPARRALRWHLDCRRGVALLPDDAGVLPEGADESAAPLALPALGEEPPWPTLVCVSGESNTVPFCPIWHASPRVHHLVPLAPFALDRLWPSEGERRHAAQWLAERLHFSLERYPEYWGSVHLVAPNPVYRSLEARLLSGTPPRESVLVRFHPRAGKSVEGLELLYTDKGPWGPLDVRRVTVHRPTLRLDFDREVQATKEDVFDPKRGMLQAWYHDAHFFKSVQINVRSEGELRRGERNASGGLERSPVPEAVPHAPPARVRMMEAHVARHRRDRAGENDQAWFVGQREEAARAVRSHLAGAEREVLIVDPLFGPDELLTFAPEGSTRGVPVQILISGGALSTSRSNDGRDASPGEQLVSELDRLASPKHMNSLEVRVMPEPSLVGGPFLLVDERLWLLSAPLHAFGDRSSVMVALPDPEPLRKHLLDTWSRAVGLRQWLAERRQDGETGAKEGA